MIIDTELSDAFNDFQQVASWQGNITSPDNSMSIIDPTSADNSIYQHLNDSSDCSDSSDSSDNSTNSDTNQSENPYLC